MQIEAETVAGGDDADVITGLGGADISVAVSDANIMTAGDQVSVFVTNSRTLAIGRARLTYDSMTNRTLFEADNRAWPARTSCS